MKWLKYLLPLALLGACEKYIEVDALFAVANASSTKTLVLNVNGDAVGPSFGPGRSGSFIVKIRIPNPHYNNGGITAPVYPNTYADVRFQILGEQALSDVQTCQVGEGLTTHATYEVTRSGGTEYPYIRCWTDQSSLYDKYRVVDSLQLKGRLP